STQHHVPRSSYGLSLADYYTLVTRVLDPLFFFYDPAPTKIYPLSLHDALPILLAAATALADLLASCPRLHLLVTSRRRGQEASRDRKSTRLNSSHRTISYAVFCLKKKT